MGYGAHSPRAGFAVDSLAAGKSFSETQERGRWAAPASLRRYLDVVGAAEVATTFCSQGLAPALAWAAHHWEAQFTDDVLAAAYRPCRPKDGTSSQTK